MARLRRKLAETISKKEGDMRGYFHSSGCTHLQKEGQIGPIKFSGVVSV